MTITTLRPRLRVLPVPDTQPAPGTTRFASPPIDGALALSFAPAGLTLVPDPFGPQPTPTHELPNARSTASFLFQAVVEVLGGRRSPAQLTRWMTHEVHLVLGVRAAASARALRRTGREPVVKSVRLSSPADGIVEASAVVIDTDRVRALAMRLEGLDGRWRVTALEVG